MFRLPGNRFSQIAVDVDLVEFAFERGAQFFAQPEHFGGFLCQVFARNLCRFAKADDAGHIQRSGSHAALMSAAIDDRRQQDARIAAPDIQSAHALRAVHFVSGQRSDVHIHFVHVERNLSGRLNRIGVEQHAALARDLPDFLDVLNDADFVVGRHDGDQDRLVRDRRFADRRD